MTESPQLQDLAVPLDRDTFLISIIVELAGTIEEIMGDEEAAAYLSLVGQKIGVWINELYKKKLGVVVLSPAQVPGVLVDLMRRIQGDFFVLEQSAEKIILGNNQCPFKKKVLGRSLMCMLTSNVFGFIAAGNLGYAKVVLDKTIAAHQDGCKVIIYLQETPEAEAVNGREYYGH